MEEEETRRAVARLDVDRWAWDSQSQLIFSYSTHVMHLYLGHHFLRRFAMRERNFISRQHLIRRA